MSIAHLQADLEYTLTAVDKVLSLINFYLIHGLKMDFVFSLMW